MEMHFATVWESYADHFGDELALVHGDRRFTWAEYDERAARLAAAYTAAGLGLDAKIGLYLYNGNEYLEAQYAGFKMRGVPINVNYRYLDDELWYLLDNSDAQAIVFHSSLADRVGRVLERLPDVKLAIEVDDGGPTGTVPGAVAYEDLVSSSEPMERIERSEDDLYMLYTGGTTGMPKGVMYTIGDMVAAFVETGFPVAGLAPPTSAAEMAPMVKGAIEAGSKQISIPGCPLMHGTGAWLGAMIPQLGGAAVVTLQARSFDPHEMFEATQRERATTLVVVGDSFVKPMVRALDEAAEQGRPYDTSSVKMVVSSGVMWTAEVKEALLERIEHAILIDAMGSSEGSMGMSISMKGVPPSTAKFSQMPNTKVFTEDGREVTPGSGEVGLVAAGGRMVPLGYFKDPEKSASTFREIDGKRYSFPGDMATVAADGSIELLGRGSQVINTGGEKVFPEEVEEAVKRVDGVIDCLVVGVEDEKFGQAVTAVASLAEGAEVDEASVIAEVKGQLAGYKAPKRVVFVSEVPRAPNGKADYKAAKQHALDTLPS